MSSQAIDLPQLAAPRASRFNAMLRLLVRDKAGLAGAILFALIVIVAITAPLLAPYDPTDQNLLDSKLPPAWQAEGNPAYPLGTDANGRDILSRVLYGTRVSLLVGFFGVVIAGGLGLAVGLVAGYMGGRTDALIMTVINVVLALPYLLFVVFIAGVLGRSLLNVILIFGITDAPIFARITRGEVLRLRATNFIEAAITTGTPQWRILLKHILPNLIGPLLTVATFELSAMIFYEAGLGFLGLSVPPETPSWG
ncbi:MAG TPA: ABC transporter permease, partial [Roseiflexaceae bacterium]|nr:ABC transporter permease [Roseiflexaceae bacterium]